ncbi:MAG: CaiB/BaiF CoA transferase family protein [Hyphomicrobiaceae bacterium]
MNIERPLEGLRVLDLSQGIAGPHCGGLFAEYGARVIKIEPTTGDWMRTLGPGYDNRSAGFIYYNRGKKSLALDLKADGASEIVRTLAESCDVFIENNRPGVSDRLGIGFDTIRARQQHIIYISISGFGQYGPDAANPLSDTVAQAHSGMMMINRGRADAPASIGTTIVDAVSGLYAFQAAIMALWVPEGRRQARHLDISLSQAAAAIQGPKILEYGIVGSMPNKLNPPAGSYATADGWIALTLVRETDWQRLCRALGREELASMPEFETFQARANNLIALTGILDETIKLKTTKTWSAHFARAGVLASPINDYGDWLAHRQTHATQGAPRLNVGQPGLGPVPRTPGLEPYAEPCPRLGQHSRSVLEEAGFDCEIVTRLITTGSVVALDFAE